jgi:hypothetical protein
MRFLLEEQFGRELMLLRRRRSSHLARVSVVLVRPGAGG